MFEIQSYILLKYPWNIGPTRSAFLIGMGPRGPAMPDSQFFQAPKRLKMLVVMT